jgi:hypothetical protein
MTAEEMTAAMAAKDDKRSWEPMRLTSLGKVGDVVQAGGGKLSTPSADPGEPLKPSGQEGR